MDDPKLDVLVAKARIRNPEATVFLLPRPDGQYTNHATDTIALLEEAGIVVDYATDPMAGGVHAEKAADLDLGALLILFSDATAMAEAINGVLGVIRWFTRDRQRTISLDVVAEKAADGSSRRMVRIRRATVDESERLLRAAGDIQPPA